MVRPPNVLVPTVSTAPKLVSYIFLCYFGMLVTTVTFSLRYVLFCNLMI